MKKTITKSVGVLLILLTLLSTLTGCYLNEEYRRGDSFLQLEFAKEYYARVESNKCIFERGDVGLTLSYGLYSLDGNRTLETQKNYNLYNEDGLIIENNFAIYISDSEELIFERNDNKKIIDYNKVNAKLWKFISFEEAFSTDYGYTTSSFKINYHYSEKITIPTEFFSKHSGTVFIHVVCLRYNVNEQFYTLGDCKPKIKMEYRLVGDKVVLQ